MAAKMRVLLADDDLESLSKLYLKLLHKQVQTEATNAKDEIEERIKRLKPHLVFISRSLLGDDAVTYCKRLKAAYKIIPVLMIDELEQETIQMETMMKPVDAETMLHYISLYR